MYFSIEDESTDDCGGDSDGGGGGGGGCGGSSGGSSGGGGDGHICKTLLKLTIPRIKLLRNRKEYQLKQMRKEIAKLLEAGQEATARIRVEHIIREENMMAAQEIIELFCELISVRLPIIETQRECPLDLKEAISSICFAAPRCADLPELQQVQLAFVSKYGKEFVASASALMPDCGVNRQLVELLSVRAPSPEKKLSLLKEIAEEHGLDWDPAPTETEIFKSHEDLLNGPTQFVSGFKAPLPKENDEILQSSLVNTESKEDFGGLEFSEAPKVSLRPSAKEDMHPSSGMPVESLEKSCNHSISNIEDMSEAADHVSPKSSANSGISRQFVPFISPSSMPLASAPVQEIAQPPKPLRTKSGASVNLNDILAAAKAAAESADQAAVAARSAASLVELRISELIEKRSGHSLAMEVENPFHASDSDISAEKEKPQLGDNPWSPVDHFGNTHIENSSKDGLDGATEPKTSLPAENSYIKSVNDESMFSYPNLFSSQSPETV